MTEFKLTSEGEMKTGALFSECREWRYSLWRIWDTDKLPIAFIGLNPSTADEIEDDPTVRRCIRFAKRWGYGSMYMLNLFGLRSTDPKLLYEHNDPVGDKNHETILDVCLAMDKIVLCWGNHGALLDQGDVLLCKLKQVGFEDKLRSFGVTKSKQPKHPLYLADNTELQKL